MVSPEPRPTLNNYVWCPRNPVPGTPTLLAKAPRREGTLGKLGLSPIAEALRAYEKSQAEAVAV
jgi:hypothetical protein